MNQDPNNPQPDTPETEQLDEQVAQGQGQSKPGGKCSACGCDPAKPEGCVGRCD